MIGIIVDGQGDFHSLKERLSPNLFKIMKTDGPRGHYAKSRDIIRQSLKQINLLKDFGCTKVIILLDFEERTCSIENFTFELEEEIKKTNFPILTQVVVINKMIENWYLADIVHLSKEKKFLKTQKKQHHYEGRHGKNCLKSLFVKNVNYNEIEHGKQLFKILEFENAKKYSESFAKFLNRISS